MTRKNAFGDTIPEIREIGSETATRNYMRETLAEVLTNLGVKNRRRVSDKIIKCALQSDPEAYEEEARTILIQSGVTEETINVALCGRAELVYRQIKPYIQGPKVIDIGCGDGGIGKRLSQDGLDMTLADVYQHQKIHTLGLKFIPFEQGSPIPDETKYHTSLILTVLHHSDDPLATLEQAKNRTRDGGRIIIIESVYGVDKKAQDPIWNHQSRMRTNHFKALSKEQQRRATIFFDHFYNRIVHYSPDPKTKVNVPFNFRQPLRLMDPPELNEEGWMNIAGNAGLEPIHFEYLGIDQPVVPEYHTLHVLQKS